MNDNQVTQTGYDDIKTNLMSLGYELKDNIFEKTIRQQQTIFINGQQSTHDNSYVLRFKYIGEGELEDVATQEITKIYGFTFLEDDRETGDTWVKSWDDFKFLFKI